MPHTIYQDWKGAYMIALELNTNQSVVRIHDDHFDSEPEKCLALAGNIVSKSYKRRFLSDNTTETPESKDSLTAANA